MVGDKALLLLCACALSLGCDDPKKAAPPPAPTASAATPAPSAPTPAAPDAAKPAASAVPMPERPVPKTSPTVGAGMPPEVQIKAIAYMAAMRAPHPDDAPVDEAFVNDLQKKLGPINLSLDTGPGRAQMNKVELVAGGRQIDLLMSLGCTAETPTRAAVQRAGIPLATLVARGVLVVRCNDSRAQCLQSTRDPTDVLCTTAPRRK